MGKVYPSILITRGNWVSVNILYNMKYLYMSFHYGNETLGIFLFNLFNYKVLKVQKVQQV